VRGEVFYYLANKIEGNCPRKSGSHVRWGGAKVKRVKKSHIPKVRHRKLDSLGLSPDLSPIHPPSAISRLLHLFSATSTPSFALCSRLRRFDRPCVHHKHVLASSGKVCPSVAPSFAQQSVVASSDCTQSHLFAMDSVLRQSKALCPFMKKASAASLRAMSTATRPQSSPCGGTISKLQVLAHRCPVMGKAMAVQSARFGRAGVAGTQRVAGLSTFSGQDKPGKAKLHTSRPTLAQPLEGQSLFGTRDKGACSYISPLTLLLTAFCSPSGPQGSRKSTGRCQHAPGRRCQCLCQV
jgi:hypothetical protein